MDGLGNKEIISKNIKYYMDKFHKDRSQICKDLGFKYSTFTDWVNGNKYPRIDKIELLSNYFGIQKSDLIEEHSPAPQFSLTKKDKREIQKKLASIMDELRADAGVAYYNDDEPMDDADKEIIRKAVEGTLELTKVLAKKKFTPKKYRK